MPDITLILTTEQTETIKHALNTAAIFYHERSLAHKDELYRAVNAVFRDDANALWSLVYTAERVARDAA